MTKSASKNAHKRALQDAAGVNSCDIELHSRSKSAIHHRKDVKGGRAGKNAKQRSGAVTAAIVNALASGDTVATSSSDAATSPLEYDRQPDLATSFTDASLSGPDALSAWAAEVDVTFSHHHDRQLESAESPPPQSPPALDTGDAAQPVTYTVTASLQDPCITANTEATPCREVSALGTPEENHEEPPMYVRARQGLQHAVMGTLMKMGEGLRGAGYGVRGTLFAMYMAYRRNLQNPDGFELDLHALRVAVDEILEDLVAGTRMAVARVWETLGALPMRLLRFLHVALPLIPRELYILLDSTISDTKIHLA